MVLCVSSGIRKSGLKIPLWPFPSHMPLGRVLSPISEKAMAPHSSTLAWKIPWTEEVRMWSVSTMLLSHTCTCPDSKI